MAKSLYEPEPCTISEILKKSTHDATFIVPDLQRPYVWSPNQVSLLIDSIFRGWPFGTLLTWTVKREVVAGRLEGIPARSFYTLVSQCPDVPEKTATMDPGNYKTEYTMILDGQQRVQSLILAFGDADGICMYDSDWKKVSDPKSKARSKSGYTTAGLCLDLAKYLEEVKRCGYRCRNVNLADCLKWAVLDRRLCSANYPGGSPVPLAYSGVDCFIPLKSMWNMTDANRNEDDDLAPLADTIIDGAFESPEPKRQFCDRFGGYDNVKKYLIPFLRRCCEIKELPITCLNVRAYEENPKASDDQKRVDRQEYDDAIVNIFTRLNTAGRALTREEITFAWVKSTWKDAGVTGGAYPKAEDFVDRIKDVFSSWDLSVDNVIGSLSIIWCDHDPGRMGRRLADRELLQASVIRNMSGFLRRNADALVVAAERVCALYEKYHLTNVTDSFNDVTIAWDLYFTGESTWGRVGESTKLAKDNATKALDEIVRRFIARWAPNPSWGRYWTVQAVPFLEKTMEAMYRGGVDVAAAPDEAAWRDRLKALSREVNQNAIPEAKDLEMRLWERAVYLYRSRLEIWQGLDESRAKFRSLTFRTAADKGEPQLNVDHVVAYALWKKKVEDAFADNTLTVEKAAAVLLGKSAEEIARLREVDPSFEAEVKRSSVEFINNIGNCMLLNYCYNIKKRDYPLSTFMDQMYEFRPETPAPNRVDREQWVAAMELADELIHPDKHSIEEIAAAILAREKLIYGELGRFTTTPEPDLH